MYVDAWPSASGGPPSTESEATSDAGGPAEASTLPHRDALPVQYRFYGDTLLEHARDVFRSLAREDADEDEEGSDGT